MPMRCQCRHRIPGRESVRPYPVGRSDQLTDKDYHLSVYFKAIDTESLVLSQPLVTRPGTEFKYKNSDPLTVASIMRHGLTSKGENHITWPRRALFDPIGAESVAMNADAFGNFLGSGMVFATARDFGKIGQLWLNEGRWGSEMLWPEGWREKMTTPSSSNQWYGGLVWLNTTGLHSNVPRDAYSFVGAFGQKVMVVPSRQLVVVRLGVSERGGVPAANEGRYSPDGFDAHFNELMGRILKSIH